MKVLVTLSVIAFALFLNSLVIETMAMRVGGISDDEKPPNDDVQNMVQSLSTQIKSAALATYSGNSGDKTKEDLEKHFETANLTALGHKTQIVAGINYFVRTKIGDYIFHVRIYRDLQRNDSVSKVIGPKQISDPIEYF